MLILIFSHVYIECSATTGLPISISGSKRTSSKWDALRPGQTGCLCLLLNGCNWSWSGILVVKTCADFVKSHNAEAPGGKLEDGRSQLASGSREQKRDSTWIRTD